MIDLVDFVSGKLTVKRFSHNKNKQNYWVCECECGKEKIEKTSRLRSGSTRSCGSAECKGGENLSGKTYGNFRVESFCKSNNKRRLWNCLCLKCEKKKVLSTDQVMNNSSCGCQELINRYKDTIGKTFGFLNVLSYSHCDGKHNFVRCECVCGNIVSKRVQDLNYGSVKSCGCQGKNAKKPESIDGYEDISSRFIRNLRNNARRRNIDFNIEAKDVWNVYLKQNKRCSLSGELIFFNPLNKVTNTQTASVDRIDSSKDYSIENIQILHKDINMLKFKYDQDFFIELCKKVADHHTFKGLENE